MDQKKLFELSDNSSCTTWSHAKFTVPKFTYLWFWLEWHTALLSRRNRAGSNSRPFCRPSPCPCPQWPHADTWMVTPQPPTPWNQPHQDAGFVCIAIFRRIKNWDSARIEPSIRTLDASVFFREIMEKMKKKKFRFRRVSNPGPSAC